MNSWHRANTVSLSGIIIFAGSIAVLIGLSKISPLAVSSSEDTNKTLHTISTTLQTAQNTSKDIWVNKKGSRYHYHLESPKSRFLMTSSPLKCEFIEEMEDMRLWMQDKINLIPKPSQEIRFIRAPNSYFLFSDLSLKTKDTFLALYSMPGKELSLYIKPEQVTLRGHAKTFDITLEEEGIKFAAKDFNAQFQDTKE